MGKWLERTLAFDEIEDVRGDRVKSPPNDPNDPNGPLQVDLVRGLRKLEGMRQPRSAAGWSGVWKTVVADALWLAGSGMAQSALALGWEPLHIFGASPDFMSDARPGLAVWLNGSRSVVLLDDGAISREGNLRRVFNVRPPAGAVYLWELGK